MREPLPEAYGRVTDPERFRVVQDAARRLVGELRSTFDVDVDDGDGDGAEADPILAAARVHIEEIVRLVPRGEGRAPLAFAFTDFPAVLVRVGRWQLWAYPGCGCDACDEDPAVVAEGLRAEVEAVTAGRFVEEWDGERLHVSKVLADGSSSSGWSLVLPDQAAPYGEPRRDAWRPWGPAVR